MSLTRDDTNNMTRDDVLRELELLPAWKLRAPIEIETKQFEKTEVEVVEAEKPISAAAKRYEITMSQDKNWSFACEISLPTGRMAMDLDIGDSQSMLLNNILQALGIEKPSKIQAASVADIDTKIIVAMGESVAQALLNTQDALENLRGKLHTMGDAQVIVTDDLAHLLAHPLDKAKVWQDLCLARAYLQNLQSKE